jgi:hypothetical protein
MSLNERKLFSTVNHFILALSYAAKKITKILGHNRKPLFLFSYKEKLSIENCYPHPTGTQHRSSLRRLKG